MREEKGSRGMELQCIQNKIYEIRGHRVILDFDLAQIYEVETRVLKQAVRRNMERFPADFMFILSKKEWLELITICDKFPENIRHNPTTPFAFTEQGAAMLTGLLRSPVAIEANINIMRAFVAVREYLLSHASESTELALLRERVYRLEQTTKQLEQADESHQESINNLYDAIDALSAKPPLLDPHRRMIGFNR